MKRFLVTGGAGFLGSHLCDHLLGLGADVVALDDLSSGRLENLEQAREHPRFTLEQGTAQDAARVDALVAGVDAVFHLAAVVGVRRVWEHPAETLANNVRGAQVVLGAAARHGRRVLFTSSSEVYGRSTRVPFHEDDALLVGATSQRRWSYACSKAMGEWLAAALARSSGLEAIVVRLFNVVGPRQSGEGGMVLPSLVRQALAGEPLTVFGDGRQTRSFLHVRDAVEALAALVAHPDAAGGVFNLGGTEEVSIGELARLVRRATPEAGPVVHMPYREAYGVGFEDPRRRRPDVSRLAACTGFRPRAGLADMVRDTLAHERRCLARGAR